MAWLMICLGTGQLTRLALVVLKRLEAGKRGAAGEELVAEARLVGLVADDAVIVVARTFCRAGGVSA
jgi:hypothetical protein